MILEMISGPENCFEPNAQYGIDGYTEKVINCVFPIML
jgi:hypothetical protein